MRSFDVKWNKTRSEVSGEAVAVSAEKGTCPVHHNVERTGATFLGLKVRTHLFSIATALQIATF
jgi:hypothetical protein